MDGTKLNHCLLVDNFWFRQNKWICFHTLTLNIFLSFSSLYPLAVLIKHSASFCWRSAQRQKLVFVAVGDGRASAEKKQGFWRAVLVQGTAGHRSLWAFFWVCCQDLLHWTLLSCPCAVYSSGVSNSYLCILVRFQVQQCKRSHFIWGIPETKCFWGGLWRSLSKRVWV